MPGLNLHDIVRNLIQIVHSDEPVLLIQNKGKTNVKGIVKTDYLDALSVFAQIQSFTNDDLKALNDVSRIEIQRKCYLYSDTSHSIIPQAIVRSLERGGDLIRREDRTWWYVTSMMEDFSNVGWVSVRITQLIEVPKEAKEKADIYDAQFLSP